MKDVLPWVEQELAVLGAYFQRFAEQYPSIAGELRLSGETSGDPHVRFLSQAAAVLNARTAKKLDDDYPELTASFLEMLAPHLLRPFPSCSVVRFDLGGSGRPGTASTIPRHTVLKTPERTQDGLICKFRTVYPVALTSVEITAAHFSRTIRVPAGALLAPEATSEIAIRLDWVPDAANSKGFACDKLRLFVDGEQSFCASLLDALFLRSVSAYVEFSDGRWNKLDTIPISPVGLAEDEALIPFPAKSQDAFRLLTEYFCFPLKYNFIDIDLLTIARHVPPGSRHATLHFALRGFDVDSHAARLLTSLSQQHLLTGCTPVANLFKQAACPITLNYAAAEYTLVPDALRASAYEVYSVDHVNMLRDAGSGKAVEFRPYYSLRHGEEVSQRGHYWVLRRDEILAVTNPGYKNRMSFVDVDFNPLTAVSATVSVELTCTNGDLPTQCSHGTAGGDLVAEASLGDQRIRLLRRPSMPCPIPTGRNVQWKLASQMALSVRSLSRDGPRALREMLAMHDPVRSATTNRQLDGIVGLEMGPARTWQRDEFGGSSVRGIAVRLTVEEAAFAGSGIHVFGEMIDRFLGMLVHLNSFTQLTLVSHETGKELLKCLPRNGDLSLL